MTDENEGNYVSKEKLKPGQVVHLKSNPGIKGVIINFLPGTPEDRYKVFIDGNIQLFYASQLLVEERDIEAHILLSARKFHSYLTSLQIQYPGLSTLYSLNAARIDFIPYQFRPVLKFIRSDRPRLLIADSVGVGKTIEAGLILRELQARRDVQSVLIICPRPLVSERKWQIEMKRFDEDFIALDGKTLRYCINETDLSGVWPERCSKVIIPYSLFDEALLYGTEYNSRRKSKIGLLDLDPPPKFDLVIVDEAHHIRNPNTYSHKAVRFFCDHAEAAIFLTATPIQLGSDDLFVLLNILRPDLIIDKESFEHMAEPNPFINRAANAIRAQDEDWAQKAVRELDKAANTPWGRSLMRNNPDFIRIRSRLIKSGLTPKERVQIITEIESLHTFSRIINRTRRKDIGDFTIRKPETIVIEFTPSQKKLHDDILRVQEKIFKKIHSDTNIKFMMTTIRRQVASCIFGLVPFLEDILNRHISDMIWAEADSEGEFPSENSVELVKSEISEILKEAQNLDPYDPKLEALKKIIKDKEKLANNKIMIFSSFRHTLYYLFENLKVEGFRVGLIHGDVPDDQRAELRNRFALDREDENAIDIMLFSEVGSEGLDYQFCDCIVNYDLPWNPMKIEQRIGRIDRWGQKSESVAIFNLITPGTIDADIYERCLLRIGVFNKALGGDEEILGDISREIRNIAENFNLSDYERKKKLQQLADNKIRLIQEQEELEQRQVELFSVYLPQKRLQEEIDDASSFWLSPIAIYNLVNNYLEKTFGEGQTYILGEKPLKTLRLSQDARSRLLEDFLKIPRQNVSYYREWEKWLKGGEQFLPITFEPSCALKYPEAAFLMPLHPLVKQASQAYYITDKRVITSLKVSDSSVPGGDYLFVIYYWQFHGIKEDTFLQPISNSEQVTSALRKLLEKAEDHPLPEDKVPSISAWEVLDRYHYKLWHKAREEHRRRTREIAQYKRESLITSHKARIALLKDQLAQATNEKIIRMRLSQIKSAEADYNRRLHELQTAVETADITAQPVAYGILKIEKEGNK